MTGAQKIQFAFILLLWLALIFLMVTSQPFSLRVGFIIVASGIIIFVPLFKKFRKQNNG